MNDSFEERVAATERLLLAACEKNDYRLSGDLAVSESAAAELMGYSGPDAMRKQASEGVNRLPFRLLGNRRLYRIRDLAQEIERQYGIDGNAGNTGIQ